MITVADLMSICFSAVLADKRGHCPYPRFISRKLQEADAEGRIIFRTLGRCIETWEGNQYDVEQTSVPIIWTLDDERRANTEAKRISLTTLLLNTAFEAHDKNLEDLLPGHRLAVSKQFYYDFTSPAVLSALGQPIGYIARLSTYYGRVPQ